MPPHSSDLQGFATDEEGNDSVWARLVRAADDEMTRQGTVNVTMASVAERAGVSRATAFRQLGGTSEMLIQVGLSRAHKHITRVREIMDAQPDVFMKMEEAMVYTTRELPLDPVITAMMAQRAATVRDQDIHSTTAQISGPVLLAGQAAGAIRVDVPLPDLIDFIVEQTYLAAEYPDRSEDAARRRFRLFVAPALRPQITTALDETYSPTADLDEAIATAADAIAAASEAAARLRRSSTIDGEN